MVCATQLDPRALTRTRLSQYALHTTAPCPAQVVASSAPTVVVSLVGAGPKAACGGPDFPGNRNLIVRALIALDPGHTGHLFASGAGPPPPPQLRRLSADLFRAFSTNPS